MAEITLPAEILAALEYDGLALRGEFGQIVEVRSGSHRASSAEILKAFGASVSEAFEHRQSSRYSSYRRNSLYGIDAHSRLAVVLERTGSWDSKLNYGSEKKRYVLIDMRTGKRRNVEFPKVRGEIRTNGDLSAAGVAGALADAVGLTKAEARRIMRVGDRVPVFPEASLVADIARVASPMRESALAATA